MTGDDPRAQAPFAGPLAMDDPLAVWYEDLLDEDPLGDGLEGPFVDPGLIDLAESVGTIPARSRLPPDEPVEPSDDLGPGSLRAQAGPPVQALVRPPEPGAPAVPGAVPHQSRVAFTRNVTHSPRDDTAWDGRPRLTARRQRSPAGPRRWSSLATPWGRRRQGR